MTICFAFLLSSNLQASDFSNVGDWPSLGKGVTNAVGAVDDPPTAAAAAKVGTSTKSESTPAPVETKPAPAAEKTTAKSTHPTSSPPQRGHRRLPDDTADDVTSKNNSPPKSTPAASSNKPHNRYVTISVRNSFEDQCINSM